MTSSPTAARLLARFAAAQQEMAAVGAEVAAMGAQMDVEDLFEITGAAQGVVNSAEGAQLAAAAHAAAHETRLTGHGPVAVHHEVGFVDAMAPSEVALVTGSTVGVAGNKVQLGADLGARFRRLLRAVMAGAVTTTAARKVVSACQGLDVEACGVVEAELVGRLPDLDPARVAAVARGVVSRVAPEQAAAQQRGNRRDRCVEVCPGPDGTTSWWALLPTSESAVAWSAVNTLAQDHQRVDPALSIGRARADAMVDLLLQRVTVDASVTLGVPVVTTPDDSQRDPFAERQVETLESLDDDTVTDHDTGEVIRVSTLPPASRAAVALTMSMSSGEPGWGAAVVMAPTAGGPAVSGCEIPGIGWVEAATVAAIFSTVPLVVGRALLDARSGTVVETTTTAYRPTRAMREHVGIRDGICRMWGCSRPSRTLDLDHTRPWPTGATTPSNLAGLCRRHHRMKQQGRWRYSLDPDGTVTWVSPTGARRVTLPDHAHWPPPSASPPEADPAPADRYPALPPF